MGRPRAFDENEVIRAAVSLFAARAYDGVSVDDLVTQLGVHRNSLYKTFGSKHGLYLAALRWHVEHQVRPLLAQVSAAPDPAQALRDTFMAEPAEPHLGLLLLAMVERAPVDIEVAEEVTNALRDFDTAVDLAVRDGSATGDHAPLPLTYAVTAAILGLYLRARAGADTPGAGTALFDQVHHSDR